MLNKNKNIKSYSLFKFMLLVYTHQYQQLTNDYKQHQGGKKDKSDYRLNIFTSQCPS